MAVKRLRALLRLVAKSLAPALVKPAVSHPVITIGAIIAAFLLTGQHTEVLIQNGLPFLGS